MRNLKKILLIVLILINTIILSACWNYREIDKFIIVAGMVIDKDKDTNKYILTGELIEPMRKGEKSGPESKIIQVKGDSIFNAIREGIELNGKKMYWGHSQIMIISEEIAKYDLMSVIDLVNRDTEIRGDMKIFVSKDNTASEILYKTYETGEEIISYKINEVLKNQKSISNYPDINFWELAKQLLAKGSSPIVPCINIEIQEGVPMFRVSGSNAFKGNKLVGNLNDIETKSALFIKDEVKGGFLVIESEVDGNKYKNTLEIFKSETKVKPEYKDNKLTMNINVEMDTGIIEIDGERDFIEKKGRQILQKDAEEYVKKNIKKVIDKAQTDFQSDIFGFAGIIMREMPKEWKEKIEPNWEEEFKKLDTNMQVKINIRNSALISKTIKVGE
ncbi:Ger(x)C family spore germination protein [Clostridium ganghwense]|uniref:Ger(X)C family spore germination protein n=1 Tax=Clostridium ganghwense TaxID=312089 RepID=A0ABT4CM35_9CLOT|nr:Ger(x)C family spore germination protein [Clostridium ganghwense]MCY6369059.1 Ger(x)C family spore germination protein [Clostridium ganghwense]